MTPTTMEKIVNITLHPTTSEEEATAAFRQLHRNASKFGGLFSMLSGGGVEIRQRLTRAQNDAVELRANLSSVTERLSDLEVEHREAVWQMERNREYAEEAETQCRQQRERVAALEAELANLKTNGAGDELGIIAQHHTQIETLAIKLKVATKALREAEDTRERYAVEQAEAARREVEGRIRAALNGEEDACASDTTTEAPQAEAASQTRRKTTKKKRAASASAKPRARAYHANRKGAETERFLLDLLTFEWKSVSVLFRAAQRIGFKGTENAIRFAAERLIKAGNAVHGRNAEGHIAFRRA